MKKRFTLTVSYGKKSEKFEYTTEDSKEIAFFTYFLKGYSKEMFEFCNSKGRIFTANCTQFVDECNELIDKICDETTIPFYKISSVELEDVAVALEEIIEFLSDRYGWSMYDVDADCYGCPVSHEIRDVSDSRVMTKGEVENYIKEKLGVDVVVVY